MFVTEQRTEGSADLINSFLHRSNLQCQLLAPDLLARCGEVFDRLSLIAALAWRIARAAQ
jgi:hypothetical protein